MDLEDVDRLHRYWERNPTTRDMIAAFIGVKPGSAAAAPQPVLELPPDYEE